MQTCKHRTVKSCCPHSISECFWPDSSSGPTLSRKAVRWCTCRTFCAWEAVGYVRILQAQCYYGTVPTQSVAIPLLKLNFENISSSDVSSVVITLENINHVLVHLPCIYLWRWRTVVLPACRGARPSTWWLTESGERGHWRCTRCTEWYFSRDQGFASQVSLLLATTGPKRGSQYLWVPPTNLWGSWWCFF